MAVRSFLGSPVFLLGTSVATKRYTKSSRENPFPGLEDLVEHSLIGTTPYSARELRRCRTLPSLFQSRRCIQEPRPPPYLQLTQSPTCTMSILHARQFRPQSDSKTMKANSNHSSAYTLARRLKLPRISISSPSGTSSSVVQTTERYPCPPVRSLN